MSERSRGLHRTRRLQYINRPPQLSSLHKKEVTLPLKKAVALIFRANDLSVTQKRTLDKPPESNKLLRNSAMCGRYARSLG